jgi:hypothetical protein
MKVNNTFFVFCMIFLMTGCAGVDTRQTYDTQANFEALKTYSWQPKTRESFSSLKVGDYVINAVNERMVAKGFTLTENDPAFLIRIPPIDRYSEVYSTMHGKIETHQAKMIIEFVNSKTKDVLWQGVVGANMTEKYTEDEQIKSIDISVAELLNNFSPPKKK